jgi:transposase InsO family protein
LRWNASRQYPKWGAPKIAGAAAAALARSGVSGDQHGACRLDRHGLVRRRIRPWLAGTRLTQPCTPNTLWCADYKGEFLVSNRRYCYRLTIADVASRSLIACEALSTTQERYAVRLGTRPMDSASSRSGGCAWASPSSHRAGASRAGWASGPRNAMKVVLDDFRPWLIRSA